jgi:peptidyl-prolyl cis-trans isomerase C
MSSVTTRQRRLNFLGKRGPYSGTLVFFFSQELPKMAKATARHILVSSEEKCNELKAQIEGGADFAEVAKENSSCPSSRQGGDLGSFGPGQMVKEFDTVVFSAPVNVVQGPVKTQFGYHLLEVTSRQD